MLHFNRENAVFMQRTDFLTREKLFSSQCHDWMQQTTDE